MNFKAALPFIHTASFMATGEWLIDGLKGWRHLLERSHSKNVT